MEVGSGVNVEEYNRQPPLQNRLRKLCIEPGMVAGIKVDIYYFRVRPFRKKLVFNLILQTVPALWIRVDIDRIRIFFLIQPYRITRTPVF